MDIRGRYNEIIKENTILCDYARCSKCLDEILVKISKKFEGETKLILVGESGVADRFMAVSNIRGVEAIVDSKAAGNSINSQTKRIRGVIVISPETLTRDCVKDSLVILLDRHIDKITYNFLISITDKMFSIYDYIARKHAELLREYNEWLMPYATGYEQLMIARRKYECAYDNEDKQSYLSRMIYLFIKFKDFISAQKYIEEYVEKGYTNSDQMKRTMDQFNELFFDIKKNLQSRNIYKDIIFIWNDGLRYDEFLQLGYMSEIAETSLVFDNAYTTVYDTRGVIGTVFNQRMAIDDYYCSNDDCDIPHSELVKILKENGYEIKGCYAENLSDKANTSDMSLYELGSRKMWDGICQLLESNHSVFLFIHELPETHNPYHNPFINKDYYFIRGCDPKDYERQIEDSRNYWDSQLRFYLEIMNYKNTKILMSDHGKPLDLEELCVLQEGYKEEYTHITLLINNEEIRPGHTNKLFSLYNFMDLIKYIFNPTDITFNNMFVTMIHLQALDRYNKGDIQKKLADGTKKRNLMAYRAVKTIDDMLIRYRDGEIRYFRNGDLFNDMRNDKKYEDRIKRLNEAVGDFFVDIYSDPFFEASRILY